MNKYSAYLTDAWNVSEPFITDWDYELLGDVLRAEFDEYFKKEEALANAGAGKSKQLLKGEYIKKFMVTKRVNLIDNPANGGLKSVFILYKNKPKEIDERAKNSLASRFMYKVKKDATGNTVTEGFMKFDLIEGVEKKEESEKKTIQVSGEDVQYFNNVSSEEKVEPIPQATENEQVETETGIEEVFTCDVCGKEFKNGRALNAHKMSHLK